MLSKVLWVQTVFGVASSLFFLYCLLLSEAHVCLSPVSVFDLVTVKCSWLCDWQSGSSLSVCLCVYNQESSQGFIRVQAPQFSKVSMAVQLTEELQAADVLTRFLSQDR